MKTQIKRQRLYYVGEGVEGRPASNCVLVSTVNDKVPELDRSNNDVMVASECIRIYHRSDLNVTDAPILQRLGLPWPLAGEFYLVMIG